MKTISNLIGVVVLVIVALPVMLIAAATGINIFKK
jgi:hypothetical protein